MHDGEFTVSFVYRGGKCCDGCFQQTMALVVNGERDYPAQAERLASLFESHKVVRNTCTMPDDVSVPSICSLFRCFVFRSYSRVLGMLATWTNL